MRFFLKNMLLSLILFALIGFTTPGAFASIIDRTDLSTVTKRYSVEFVPGESISIAVLRENVEDLRRQLVKDDRAAAPMDWAEGQHAFGVILRIFEERDFAANPMAHLALVDTTAKPSSQNCESCLFLLRESISAFGRALEIRTRRNAPTDWAETQYEMGRALLRLSELEPGIGRLREASDAFREALRTYNRGRHPEQWGSAQFFLAETLQRLGDLETGNPGRDRLNKSISAYQEALKVFTLQNRPDGWAAIQNNMGNAQYALGERERNKRQFQRAVESYRAALTVVTSENNPWFWAAIQNNLGNTLRTLGVNEKSKSYLEEARNAYNAALTVRTPDRDISIWGGTKQNLAHAFRFLGILESGTAASEYLSQSVSAYRAVLETAEREQMTLVRATLRLDMATALHIWGIKENDIAKLEDARDIYRDGINILVKEKLPPMLIANFMMNFALLLIEVSDTQESDTTWLEEAIYTYRVVWSIYDQKGSGVTPQQIASLQWRLNDAERRLKIRQPAQ